MRARELPATPQGIADAAAMIRAGRVVALPTETVYGLGADAANARACAEVFAVKGRPRFNPLIAHIPDLEAALRLADLTEPALRLAEAFWPGPLTLVAPRRPGAGLADLVSAGLPTVALRAPAHPVARALLQAAETAIAAPSANPSGRLSPTRAGHVMEALGDRIAAVLDGGPCARGLESTIVGFADDGTARLLRPGALPRADIEAIVGPLGAGPSDPDRPVAPGALASHYAPRALLRLNAAAPLAEEAYLGFGAGGAGRPGDLNLSARGDLTEAAANLFDHLRRLDAGRPARIAVAPIPETGLGEAINDRLRRAAAPRPHPEGAPAP